jgi:hypothetical protein
VRKNRHVDGKRAIFAAHLAEPKPVAEMRRTSIATDQSVAPEIHVKPVTGAQVAVATFLLQRDNCTVEDRRRMLYSLTGHLALVFFQPALELSGMVIGHGPKQFARKITADGMGYVTQRQHSHHAFLFVQNG